MIGEEVYHLSTGNNWVIGIISGTRDSGRSYDVLTEGGTSLRRNRSHLKPRSHDIPVLNKLSFQDHTHPPKVKYPVRAFQDQHILPKRNILSEQLTMTIF